MDFGVQKFLEKKSDRKKLIVIFGPTASGKTEMSIEIAKFLQSEIISTDSRQLFRGMDIGTGKITQEEAQGVIHHMIDILDPNEAFSMGDFVKKSEEIMMNLWGQGKIPMLVGGTGLYIDSLIFERNAPEIARDKKLRKELDTLSNQQLYKKLQEIDPQYAKDLHPNNRPYIERAIEIKILTGKSKSEYRSERKLKFDVLFLSAGYKFSQNNDTDIIFTPEYRAWLYDRINLRVHGMIEGGLAREVEGLLEKGYNFDDFGMNSIGYREFKEYFMGNMTLKQVEEKIAQNSRNYAKRQLTWFQRYREYIES